MPPATCPGAEGPLPGAGLPRLPCTSAVRQVKGTYPPIQPGAGAAPCTTAMGCLPAGIRSYTAERALLTIGRISHIDTHFDRALYKKQIHIACCLGCTRSISWWGILSERRGPATPIALTLRFPGASPPAGLERFFVRLSTKFSGGHIWGRFECRWLGRDS